MARIAKSWSAPNHALHLIEQVSMLASTSFDLVTSYFTPCGNSPGVATSNWETRSYVR